LTLHRSRFLQAALAGIAEPDPQLRGKNVPLPAYRPYTADFEAFARAILDGRALPVTAAGEIRVQRALLSACRMI
jgi:predicted dehydrogenase